MQLSKPSHMQTKLLRFLEVMGGWPQGLPEYVAGLSATSSVSHK